ncbi:MAG: valine--tRNA ligase, partial [Alphaproteobacteria bacterium]|nr:valine--tRNA ligase [Alphaproteobacteria bacterium]
SLHMGHALNNTLQDVLVRFERMRGRDVLWQPGTDHAGIATQMVVERRLEAEGKRRADLGRDAFIVRVWQWKEQSGGTIINQLRRLGASCDWRRERFTMDEGLSRAVRRVFVELYRAGLIYKDQRLVNWDCKLHTAISDLEVQNREVKGKLWHIRYPLEGEPDRFIVVATTRPETMLGDSAIAVHPDDPRYRDLIGRHAMLPLVARRLPIVGDQHADPAQGSGAVKITPAHDFNDFEVGRRHGLELINILDADARINDNAPEKYRGLDRAAARAAVLADLEALGMIARIDEHTHTLPFGDRSGEVIEPWLTEQWYLDAKTLAKPAIEAVERGAVVFVPRQWENTYFEWMHHIQPWCISRQLWWGHQIPAWYGPDERVFVAMSEDEAMADARRHYGAAVALQRDPDVLDTWFSSQLWPFSTLGWPDKTAELARYYPTDVLVTGFDIIFFWVARMIMAGIHFMGSPPFHTVYVHALVRDELGQKMSKSKGNVMDPLEVIDRYGADALRFTLCAMAAQGRDIKLSEARVEGYRNFATKLWNAARFCLMNGCRPDPAFVPEDATETLNRWILGEGTRAAAAVTEALETYRYNEAAAAIYQFVWGTFCDWYIELAKPVLQGPDGPGKHETRAAAAHLLNQILRLLHPVMPFITEELWAHFRGGGDDDLLIRAAWPDAGAGFVDTAADDEMRWVIDLVARIRSVRNEANVPAGAQIPIAHLRGASAATAARLARQAERIRTLARVSDIAVNDGAPPPGTVQFVHGEATVALPIGAIVDLAAERARLENEIDRVARDVERFEQKLANEGFLSRAPADVIEEQRERLADAMAARDKLAAALRTVATAGA